jgi:nitrate reductase gamma subunit
MSFVMPVLARSEAEENRMSDFINQLAFGWFPYLAVTVLIVGSILRFDKDQYSWRSQSSQFLRRRQMVLGSNLFHLGVLMLLGGHFIGLLTPINVFDTLGVSRGFKQTMALVFGGIAGVAALVGCTLLLHRRLFDPRIRRSSSWGDILVLVLIWLQLVLGVATTWWTLQHLDGSEMVRFMGWAQGILTVDPAAPQLIKDVALVYKLHIILGLILFLITPFTRLVHIWSAPIWFLLRPGYQIVRSRASSRRAAQSPTRGPAGTAPTYGGTTVLRQESDSGQST